MSSNWPKFSKCTVQSASFQTQFRVSWTEIYHDFFMHLWIRSLCISTDFNNRLSRNNLARTFDIKLAWNQSAKSYRKKIPRVMAWTSFESMLDRLRARLAVEISFVGRIETKTTKLYMRKSVQLHSRTFTTSSPRADTRAQALFFFFFCSSLASCVMNH